MSSDLRIDPSTTSTHLDYGENPNRDSRQQDQNARNQDQESKTYLDHESSGAHQDDTRLKSRKARKKKDRKKKKIAERQTKQNREDDARE